MKQLFSYIGLGMLLSVMGCATAADVRIRSQSVDTARELAGWTDHVNLYDVGCFYGSFAVTPEYTQSFHGRQIARSLFGSAINNAATTINNNCNNNNGASFRVSGSQSPNRQAGDLLADYFGLPLDYQSTVYVKPEIQNFLVDFDLFLGLDDYLEGLWFRIHAPVVYAKWKLRMNEVAASPGSAAGNYPAGYFSPAVVPYTSLNTSFVSYLQGNVPILNGGVTFQPLANAKIPSGKVITGTSNGNCSKSCNSGSHTTRLSDIRFALGWNFAEDEDYHVGLGLLVAAPTGNRVNDRLLFQPMVGNGHHWEFGGKFTSHYTFWTDCDYEKSLGFYLDVDLTHLFAACQFRVFDLCARGDNSKYMLAENLTSTVVDHLEGNPAPAGTPFPATVPTGGYFAANYQFDNIFTPVANIAAQNVKVKQDIQVDLTAMFNYTHCNFTWDLGYNFWMTSAEKFKSCTSTSLFSGNTTYALKGDAYVYGFDPVNTYDPIALSATNNNATICSGSNYPVGTFTPFPAVNTGIDSALYAYGDAAAPFTANNPLVNVTAGATVANQTETSIQPIFLADNDIDLVGARAKGLSNKVFTHVSYTWEDCECYIPYLGIGGKAEFASNKECCNIAPCSNTSGCSTINSNSGCGSFVCADNKAIRTNISEWGIWLKGGFSF